MTVCCEPSHANASDDLLVASLLPSNRRLRILVVTSTFPRWDGDAEPRFVLDLCRHLSDRADILVLAPHAPGAAFEEVLEGVHVRRFHYFIPRWHAVAYRGGIKARLRENRWRLLQLPLFLAGMWWALRRSIRAWSPDVIHAHWVIPQGLVACLARAHADIPILCTSHGGDLYALRGHTLRMLKQWTLRRCRSATVVSESMVPHVRALTADLTVDVIPMGTDLTVRFVPPSSFVQRDSDHLLFVGRLVEKKGLRYLLEAVAAIADTHPNLRLTVAGDGPLKDSLLHCANRLGIAERVTFLGSVRHSELPTLYQRGTLAVFPFIVADDGDQEGFGLVVVEAMGCGCPVIAHDLPAVRQTIQHGVTGTLTPPGDVGALANAIKTHLSDPSLGTRQADAALRIARTQFDWPVIARRYFAAIQCLVND